MVCAYRQQMVEWSSGEKLAGLGVWHVRGREISCVQDNGEEI
jgi:hypothetical protein